MTFRDSGTSCRSGLLARRQAFQPDLRGRSYRLSPMPGRRTSWNHASPFRCSRAIFLINGGKLPDRAETAEAIPSANTDNMKCIGSRLRGCQNGVVPNQQIGGHSRLHQRRLVFARVSAIRAAGLGVQSIELVRVAPNGDPELAVFLSVCNALKWLYRIRFSHRVARF
jgi:hypothetical protein